MNKNLYQYTNDSIRKSVLIFIRRYNPHLCILLIAVFLSAFSATAQQHTKKEAKPLSKEQAQSVKHDANSLFAAGSYDLALKGYLDLYRTNPKNADLNFHLGYCYLMTDINKPDAVKYLEYAVQNDSKKKELLYYLALAYHYANRFDDAIKYYNEYINQVHSKIIKEFLNADRQIEMCESGKELIAHPINVTFENPGKSINSPQQDYNPYISADGATLVFTSRRKGSTGGLDEDALIFGADIYWAQWKDTAWAKAKSVGAAINQQYDEESVWLNLAGDAMMVYMDNLDAYGDIGLAHLKGKTWQHAELFKAPINTKAFETGGTISPDGKILVFVSDRKDGSQGGRDLFMCTRESIQDNWGLPKNLGNTVNTKYNEDSPFFWIDGKTLFFASEGHNSMGGSDIFKTIYDPSSGEWSDPVNLGYPISTADDDNSFSLTGDGRTGYVTQVRPGGIGNKDIYKVTFNDTSDHPFLAVIKGIVINDKGIHTSPDKALLINKADNSVAFDYAPSPGSNVFVMGVRPGTYTLHLEGANFDPYNEDITIGNEFPPKNITKQIKVHASDKK